MKSAKEWMEEKINDKTIRYFDYKEFSNIVEIGRGGFGKVSNANLACMGIEVALKSSINENTTFGKEELDELIKEVRIMNISFGNVIFKKTFKLI